MQPRHFTFKLGWLVRARSIQQDGHCSMRCKNPVLELPAAITFPSLTPLYCAFCLHIPEVNDDSQLESATAKAAFSLGHHGSHTPAGPTAISSPFPMAANLALDADLLPLTASDRSLPPLHPRISTLKLRLPLFVVLSVPRSTLY